MKKKYSVQILAIVALLLMHLTSIAKTYSAFQVTVTGKGQPVILIPGATCSGAEWNETVAQLQDTHECHVLTLAGYAGVPPMQGETKILTAVKEQIINYINDKKLKNVVIVGHSIGGVLAMWIATERPSQLSKIVIVDALPFFAAITMPNAKDGFDPTQAEKAFSTYNAMSDSAYKATQLGIARFMCRDSSYWPRIVSWSSASDKRTMAYTMTEMNSTDLREKVAKIEVPALVLVAYAKIPQYPSFTREAVTYSFQEQYKKCTTCTLHVAEDNTKHFIMYDNPKWFYKELKQFIKG